MAVVYRCAGILTVDVVVFFWSPGVFFSQDSFPSTFRPRLWETFSGVVAVGVFAAEARSSLLILQPFYQFTYVTPHFPTLPSLYLRHSSLSNPFVASPTSQLILQPFFRLSYVMSSAHSPTLPLLHLRHSSFSSPSFASLTSQIFTYVTWRAAHSMNWNITCARKRFCSFKDCECFWRKCFLSWT